MTVMASMGWLKAAGAGGALALVALGSWALGMKAGYGFAKQDAARILAVGMENDLPTRPKWRAWADSNVEFTPPQDLEMVFSASAVEIPYSGGMTTGDVWNGYQTRLDREFFDTSNDR